MSLAKWTAALLCLGMAWCVPLLAADRVAEVRDVLRSRLITDKPAGESAATRPPLDWPLLQKFYQSRDYRPVWVNGMLPNSRALSWRTVLRQSTAEGLDPQDYHLPAIEQRWFAASSDALVSLELLMTDSFVRYSTQVRAGRLSPGEVDPDWHIKPPPADGSPLDWLSLDAKKFDRAIAALPPPQAGYRQLRDALARYLKIEYEGGWPRLPPGRDLKLGQYDRQVALLCLRLIAEGDLHIGLSADLHSFDLRVRDAVKRFQARHGLKPDGVVGSATRAAMNVPVARRIEQIRANMERWRWLPRQLGERYVMVNTAGYDLEVKERERTVLAMRVITGEKDAVTPVLGARLQAVQFNPFWLVPSEIAAEELLPLQQHDPNYLSSRGYRVFDKWGDDARELDPAKIRWSKFNKDNFHYKLRQDPGPNNSLGRMKFIFQNNFEIYLHDTPHRRLFNQPNRALSHGCVRVEHPMKLALYLLKGHPEWDRQTINDTLDSGATVTVGLPESVPIYLVYWTAWAGPGGAVNFREDVYQRDQYLRAAAKNRQ